MSRVIIIGCGTAGFAVVRALSPFEEIELIALTHTSSEMACCSRRVSQVSSCPHPGENEEAFIEFLMERGPTWNGALLLETGDYMSIALSRHKSRLSKFYRLATADWAVLKRFIEKSELHRMAQELGVPCPRTFHPKSAGELSWIGSTVLYPCILKPVNSHLFVSRYGLKNFEIRDEQSLRDRFERCVTDGVDVVVQEIVPGDDNRLERLQTYVDSQGCLSARFFHNKLRQNPPKFGVMRVGYSTERNSEVEVLAERLLVGGGYRGYASIEFKRDPRDNKLKLIEVNVRMPRSGMLAVASGVNFPWIIYNDLVKERQIFVENYEVGLYWIELLPELLNATVNPYGEHRYRMREYLRPYLARQRVFADLDIRDPMPFLKQLGNGVVQSVERFARRRSALTRESNGNGSSHSRSQRKSMSDHAVNALMLGGLISDFETQAADWLPWILF